MNLTETSKWFKIFSIFLIILVVLYYFFVYILFPATGNFLRSLIPERNPPTLLYGVLPPLQFINKEINGEPSFELNTETGRLPRFSTNKLPVYRIIQNPYSFDSGKKAQEDAYTLGFNDNDLITDLKGDTYRWRNLNSGIQAEINLKNRNLIISSNLEDRGDDYIIGGFNNNSSLEFAKETLSKIQRIDTLYSQGNSKVTPGRYQNERLIEVEDFNRAHLYRVDLFRSINGYRIFGPDQSKGLINLYIGSDTNNPNLRDRSNLRIPSADIYFNDLVRDSDATYPLIPVEIAWNKVKSGEAIYSSVTPRGANPFAEYEPVEIRDILINNISLAYYENYTDQEYLQPIYVFSGNYRSTINQGGDITIYYPAIEGRYIKSVEN